MHRGGAEKRWQRLAQGPNKGGPPGPAYAWSVTASTGPVVPEPSTNLGRTCGAAASSVPERPPALPWPGTVAGYAVAAEGPAARGEAAA